MKPYTFLLSLLTWMVASVATQGTQHVLDAPHTEDSTTVPFFLAIPGTLLKAGGNVTVTANSNGTVSISTRTQLFDRAPSNFRRSWSFSPHKTEANLHTQQSNSHEYNLLGPYIALDSGITIPITAPIPGSTNVAKGNATIGIQLDGKLHINTILEATLDGGDRITSGAKDSIGVIISATGGFRKEGCGRDEVCMLPEVEIEIQEEDIDVRINTVNGNTAIDIYF